VATDIKPSKTSNGAPQVQITFRCVEGPEEGYEFSDFFSMNPVVNPGKQCSAADVTTAHMKLLGLRDGGGITDAKDYGFGELRAVIRLENKEFNGNTRERVTGIYAVNERPDTVTATEVVDFDRIFKESLAKTPDVARTPSNRAPSKLPDAKPAALPKPSSPYVTDF
jgi:hypothetical protein